MKAARLTVQVVPVFESAGAETAAWLRRTLAAVDHVPAHLRHLPDDPARAAHLLDTACELEVAPGQRVQWYAVRLEPDSWADPTVNLLAGGGC